MISSIALGAASRLLLFASLLVGTAPELNQSAHPNEPLYACTPRQAERYATFCRSLDSTPWRKPTDRQLPLPTRAVDPKYQFAPFEYLQVDDGGAYLFPSEGAAERGSNARGQTGDGFVYLASPWGQDGGSGSIYSTQQGYVRSDDVRRVRTSTLQGLSFYRTPLRRFGWVNAGGVCPRRAPSPDAEIGDRCFTRYHVVKILEERETERGRWLRIRPDLWLPDELVAVVRPDRSRPEGVEGNRWIRVNLAEQVVTVYEAGELVYATVASTGRYGFWTKPGTFQVWAKLERDNMTGGVPGTESYYYLEDVPWVLYFDESRALHGTYWHDKFGAPSSRGCVNLSPADARWIYEFGRAGLWVHVWDPTGETPTDPSLYGPGGA